ncbi:hypothetical protein GCM10022236_10560 [Microlunatus ginsengisoli]|uniref:Uncharacterized protein n=1 Tax=Microlunatus ginsengisoli TaxID=363863 RepID=A0ABP6ZKY3_9ACTN
MSVAELETRPARGRERTTGPRLRPASGVRAPRLRSAAASAQPRACRSTPAPPTRIRAASAAGVSSAATAAPWRLTDRGIALVLVAAAMLAVAALAVVIPTALQVTGEDYRPAATSHAALP